MTSNLFLFEDNRFKTVWSLFRQLHDELDFFDSSVIDKRIISNLIGQLEDVTMQSPEWVSRDLSIDTVNLTFFGKHSLAKREIIKKFLSINSSRFNQEKSIKLKHIITRKDDSKQLLMIRDDGDNFPDSSTCDWSDCGIFVFNIYDEESISQAIIDQQSFNSHRTKRSMCAPTILVGTISPLPSETFGTTQQRTHSYIDLNQLAKKNNFDQYIEVKIETTQNIKFVFEFATEITLKYREVEKSMKNRCNCQEDTVGDINWPSYAKKRKTLTSSEFRTPNIPGKNRSSIRDLAKNMVLPSVKESSKPPNRASSITNYSPNKTDRYSITSFVTVASSVEENIDSIEWMSSDILKQGSIMKCKSFGSDNVFLTINKNGKMFYHKSKKHFDEGKSPNFIDLSRFNAKVPENNSMNGFIISSTQPIPASEIARKKSSCRTFELVGMSPNNKSTVKIIFKAEEEEERNRWMDAIRAATLAVYNKVTNVTQYPNVIEDMQIIQSLDWNEVCAECNAVDPTWISCNVGVFICTRCAGGHRSLGTSVSKVASTTLDVIDPLQARIMAELGNGIANSVFEATLVLSDVKKPEPDESDICSWLQMKYVEKRFLAPLPLRGEAISRQMMMAITEQDYRTQLLCLAHASKEQLDAPYSVDDERNSLLIAAQSGSPISVRLLLWAGVDCFVVDKNQLNAHAYASYGKTEQHLLVESILVQSGVSPQIIENVDSGTEVVEPSTVDQQNEENDFITKRKKVSSKTTQQHFGDKDY